MRKDKLDEIKNILNYESEIYFLKGNEVIPHHKITKENLKWLIEQAERVQELEGERDEWRDTSQSYYMTNQELRGQNKRYREAREIMEQVYKDNYVRNAYGYEDGYLDGLDTAMDIIDKALEGEE